MNSQAGAMLTSHVLPLITAAIARGTVSGTGSEDQDELKQDAVALAAKQW